MRLKNIFQLQLFVLIFSLIVSNSWATEKPKSLRAIEVFSGFGAAKLKELGNYHILPLFVGFDFDIKGLVKKIGINIPGLLQFVEEPFTSYVYEPDNNAEVGNNFLIKIGFFPDNWKFQPYFKGGVGIVYLTQHTREQGSQFNFNEYAGLGMHYFFNKNVALTAEYRFRHLSNSRIARPNHGISTQFALLGVAYYF